MEVSAMSNTYEQRVEDLEEGLGVTELCRRWGFPVGATGSSAVSKWIMDHGSFPVYREGLMLTRGSVASPLYTTRINHIKSGLSVGELSLKWRVKKQSVYNWIRTHDLETEYTLAKKEKRNLRNDTK
jgi:hypothetical protein